MVKQLEEYRRKQKGLLKPVTEFLSEDHMRVLGISNTMRLALAVNGIRYRREEAYRQDVYRNHFQEALEENGAPVRPLLELRDGWVIDTSMTLPYLDEVLADSEEIIRDRAGVRTSKDGAYRSYFQDMWTQEDTEKYPSFLNLATSSDVVGVIANHMKTIPMLSSTIPEGIRFVESNAAFDDQPDSPHDSQLLHMDYRTAPNTYVLVLLHDTTFEHGPWTFLPAGRSKTVAKKLRYWKRGVGYRYSDDEFFSVADRSELIEFSYPRGTVLIIESSGCFHFGSRNSVVPRFQLMIGYARRCRSDFTEDYVSGRSFPTRPGDSRLRKLVCDKTFRG